MVRAVRDHAYMVTFDGTKLWTKYPICNVMNEVKSLSICRYLLRPLGLEIDYVNHRDKREHIYLTFQKPEDRQKLYHKMISQVSMCYIYLR